MTEVIFLNGPSSSGKTSIAKELQRILPDAYRSCWRMYEMAIIVVHGMYGQVRS